MGALLVVAVTFVLLWVIFILPQQRRVRGHQALVASLDVGDEVVLTAGIYGRIVAIGPEDMTVEVAPGIELRVARQAVLRRVEDATRGVDAFPGPDADTTDAAGGAPAPGGPTDAPDRAARPETDDPGPATPGSPL